MDLYSGQLQVFLQLSLLFPVIKRVSIFSQTLAITLRRRFIGALSPEAKD